MKPFKAKSEYVILSVLIVALLLYLILRNPDRIHYQLPVLSPVDRGEADRIDVEKAGQTVRLEKKGGQWLIQPQGFPADTGKVDAMLDAVFNLSLSALVSESKSYSPYGLDAANAITVKASKAGKVLRKFALGNVASTYRHTFVKLAGDDRVYHAKNSFRDDFDQKADGLRDKTVMQFDKNEISAIAVESGGEKLLFTRNAKPADVTPAPGQEAAPSSPPPEAATWLAADGTAANHAELNGIVEQASQLSCERFVEGKAKEDFQGPVFTVVLKGHKDFQLSIFSKEEKETSYTAVSSENPYPFLLSAYTVESIMKKPEVLKKEKPAAQ